MDVRHEAAYPGERTSLDSGVSKSVCDEVTSIIVSGAAEHVNGTYCRVCVDDELYFSKLTARDGPSVRQGGIKSLFRDNQGFWCLHDFIYEGLRGDGGCRYSSNGCQWSHPLQVQSWCEIGFDGGIGYEDNPSIKMRGVT